jgi:hypothetical protein
MGVHISCCVAALAAAVVILFVLAIMTQYASAIVVFPGNSSAYGSTYAQWTAKWWAWLMSIPTNINPAADTSGINCARGQAGPVWFLAGSLGGHAERTCTIPAGEALLFPVINSECSYAETPKLTSEAALRSCAVLEIDKVSHVQATVDGVSLQSSQIPRVQSPLFNFIFPPNGIFGAPAGPSQSVSDGYWVFLHPLPAGSHELAWKAVEGSFTTTAVVNSAQDLLVHLKVR